jgi:hypothetical protein
MSQPMECPRCEVISPPGTAVCDCGYVFSAAGDATEYAKQTTRMLVSGVVFTVLGWGAFALLYFVLFDVIKTPVARLSFGLLIPGPALLLNGLRRLIRKPS